LTCSQEDYNLYISTKANIILLLWVDNILLFSPSKEAIQGMKNRLYTKYKMSDLGPVQQFLGIQVIQDQQAGKIHLYQALYIESVLRRFQMENSGDVSTPMDPNSYQTTATYDYIATRTDLLVYQQAIGSIMYAMLGTRPDLTFTISALSKYCSNPTPEHSIAVQRLLQYLRKTRDTGITYSGQVNPVAGDALSLTGLTGFTDSD
jgi:hypothetical protein